MDDGVEPAILSHHKSRALVESMGHRFLLCVQHSSTQPAAARICAICDICAICAICAVCRSFSDSCMTTAHEHHQVDGVFPVGAPKPSDPLPPWANEFDFRTLYVSLVTRLSGTFYIINMIIPFISYWIDKF